MVLVVSIIEYVQMVKGLILLIYIGYFHEFNYDVFCHIANPDDHYFWQQSNHI